MSKVLEVHDVVVRFGGVTAVDGASLTVDHAELVGFIGPNGAGKTTLMRVITGIVKPDEGKVLLEGVDLHQMSIDRRIRSGMALAQQIVQPLREMTLLQNVTLACGRQKTVHPWKSMRFFNHDKEQERARELLARVGISEAGDAFPSTLPLGFLKRLEVARALALDPVLLLLDEPLAGLNQSEAEALANLIRELNERGLAILLIEHNLREVMRICPKVYVQDNGKPLATGKTDEIMQRADVRKAYFGGSS